MNLWAKSFGVTIKIPFCSTFTRYYLFHYVVETFDFVDEIFVIIQMKPLWLYVRMLRFVFQYLIKWTLDLLVLLLREAFLSVKGLNFSWSCFAELSWGQIIWGRNCNITGVDISCSSWELLFIYYYYYYYYYHYHYYYYYYYYYHYYYLHYYYDSQKTEMKSSGEKWET